MPDVSHEISLKIKKKISTAAAGIVITKKRAMERIMPVYVFSFLFFINTV